MTKTYRTLLLAATLALPAAAAQAEYPESPVTWVFPNNAGGGIHTLALTVVDLIKDEVPQPINVSPMPGAGTVAGTRYVLEQPADGYTLLFIHDSPFQTSAMGLLGRDVPGELEPIVQVANFCFGLFVAPDAPYSNLTELQAFAMEHPGELNVAVNTGSLSHLNMLRMQDLLGVEFNLVPATGGGAASRASLIAGEVDVIDQAAPDASGLLRAGQIKGLGWYGEERDPSLPDLPTIYEQGFEPEQNLCTNGYLWGRSDLPQEVKDYWGNVIGEVLASEEGAQAVLDKTSLPTAVLSGADLDAAAEKAAAAWKADLERFGLMPN